MELIEFLPDNVQNDKNQDDPRNAHEKPLNVSYGDNLFTLLYSNIIECFERQKWDTQVPLEGIESITCT